MSYQFLPHFLGFSLPNSCVGSVRRCLTQESHQVSHNFRMCLALPLTFGSAWLLQREAIPFSSWSTIA